MICETRGDIREAQGRLHEAKSFYFKCMDLRKGMAEETDTAESYDYLAASYYKLGTLTGDRQMLEQALAIWTRFSELYPDIPLFRAKTAVARDEINRLSSKKSRWRKYFGTS